MNMRSKMLVGFLVSAFAIAACSGTAPIGTTPIDVPVSEEEEAPAEEAPAADESTDQTNVEDATADSTSETPASTAAPENGPYMPLTADADIQTKNPVNNEPFPQTDIQVMFLSDLEIPAAQEELTMLYTEAGWIVNAETQMSTVSLTATPPPTSTWKGTCTMGLQKGNPEVMGTPKLVVKGLCYAN